MAHPETNNDSRRDPGAQFAPTQWSVVLAAAQTSSLQADAALESLCRTYWFPLYGYVRRRGHSSHDAQDLTQEFFARLLKNKSFAGVNRLQNAQNVNGPWVLVSGVTNNTYSVRPTSAARFYRVRLP